MKRLHPAFTGSDNQVRGAEVEDIEWKVTDGKCNMFQVQGTRRIIPTDFVLLALGFVHSVLDGLVSELGLELSERKNLWSTDPAPPASPGSLHAAIR